MPACRGKAHNSAASFARLRAGEEGSWAVIGHAMRALSCERNVPKRLQAQARDAVFEKGHTRRHKAISGFATSAKPRDPENKDPERGDPRPRLINPFIPRRIPTSNPIFDITSPLTFSHLSNLKTAVSHLSTLSRRSRMFRAHS